MKKHRATICTAVVLLLFYVLSGCTGLSKEMYVTGIVPPDLAREIHGYTTTVENKVREQYTTDTTSPEAFEIQAIVDRLQPHCRRSYLKPQVAIITNPRYANSCTGGQNIFIGTTLARAFPDEDMMAFIMAHELAHIDTFHSWRTFKRTKKKRWITTALSNVISIGAQFIPGGAPVSIGTTLATSGLKMINGISAEIIHRGYGKGMEYEADYEGYLLMGRAGYDQEKALVVLEKLDELGRSPNWLHSLGVLSTHPSTEKRVKRLAKAID